ncbi:MAG: SpoVR family protein [Gammaproteobacteria bacterium]
MKRPLSSDAEWSFPLIKQYDKAISKVAQDYGLDTYSNQIEVISSQQMIDAYASFGMPMSYYHWSFGKKFVNVEKNYKRGQMGLAYEMVINSDPCIAYLMEENTMAMQALVIAHACYGHNSFFKNNYLFKLWTSADSIIDYLFFAKNYIAKCEQKYSVAAVEEVLDACHSLMNHGVNRYKRPAKLSLQEEKVKQENREQYLQSQVNRIWSTIPQTDKLATTEKTKRFPEEPQENILYFLEKNAPLLHSWQREIVRIVRKLAQYYYPQKQTKIMNEGWATFWHYVILNALYDDGLVTDEFMLEVLQSHTNVIYQPPFDHPNFSGINPYTLGFKMMADIRRICENPTEEDKHWFPEQANTDWKKSLDFAMRNFKDESFIAQYLSPHLIRELKLFSLLDDDKQDDLLVTAIHNEHGYQSIREKLSKQFSLAFTEPDIQVYNVNVKGDRVLTLRHMQHDRRSLGDTTNDVLRHLHRLWRFPVCVETISPSGETKGQQRYPED